MKKIILLIAIVLYVTQLQAQKIIKANVPAEVKAAFHKAYPSIIDVKWSKDGKNFEAEYDANKVDMSNTYSADGTLIETEMEITASDLPKEVLEYLKNNYSGDKIKEASKITDSKGIVTFEAEVKGMDLIFNDIGNFIKSVKE